MCFIFFILFFLIWLALNGKFDALHMSLGLFSSFIVAYASRDLLRSNYSFTQNIKTLIRLFFYVPWLIFQIIKSNINVSLIILSKDIEKNISPVIFTYKTKLKNDLAKLIFANSITLPPGTVTISLLDDKLVIHALQKEGALEGIEAIENKLLKVFKED
ncbi:MAG: Na+/H+ antiporter subunit E [Bdellovibrionota bacterium]